MAANRRSALLLIVLAVSACGPATPGARAPGPQAPGAEPRSGPTKTITIAQLNPVRYYGPWEFGNTAGGGAQLAEVHTNGLVADSVAGGLEPRLAAGLPSLDDGTIVVLPDGRMQTTWKLRANVKWHDGAPFTADDIVFSWRVETHPELLSGSTEPIRRAEKVEALDPSTVVITWKTAYFPAVEIGHRVLWPLPKHILSEGFEGDTQAFLGHAYFTTEYVNLGPFRLVDFGLGENQVFERFDGYFLGRPRVDRIILRTISDPNTILANIKGGGVDMASEGTWSPDVAIALRDEWSSSGAGVVVERQENWWYLKFQFDPQYARPVEMSRDIRIRRGLLFGMDRNAIGELLLPGYPDTNGDTFTRRSDPRAPVVGKPFARYPYDPRRATDELVAAGWRRGSDGRLLNPAGEHVQIEIRGGPAEAKAITLIAANWRQLGIEPSEVIPPPALLRDSEYKGQFPGLEASARSTGPRPFLSFDSRVQSTLQNRWTGTNNSHYANPELDQLLDRFWATLDQPGQSLILKNMGELAATDLPMMPFYFRMAFAAVVKEVRALTDDYASSGEVGFLARNAHLWDRD